MATRTVAGGRPRSGRPPETRARGGTTRQGSRTMLAMPFSAPQARRRMATRTVAGGRPRSGRPPETRARGGTTPAGVTYHARHAVDTHQSAHTHRVQHERTRPVDRCGVAI